LKVDISKITISEGRRPVRDIQSLADSIKEIGLINPIFITTNYRLIAGLHRLEACKLLGWKEIPAIITDLKGLRAELAEIDENLIRNDLTVLERAEELKRRKKIYETLYPETMAYSSEKQRQRREKEPSEIISSGFSIDTAQKINTTPRTIQQEIQIATNLSPEVKEMLIKDIGKNKDNPLADNKTELLKLARMEHERQKEIVKKVVSGEVNTIREAMQEINREKYSTNTETCSITELQQLIDSGKKFGTIYADPPWDYSNHSSRGATNNHYPTMALDEISALPIPLLTADDAHLHLWTPNSFLFDSIKIQNS
jgi:ParB family chromosome partitioning protein